MYSATVTDAARPGPYSYPSATPAGAEGAGRAAVGAERCELASERAQLEGAGLNQGQLDRAGLDRAQVDGPGHAVWRQYLRGHATVVRALEAELLAERQLSLAAYDVLAELAGAPERRMRMTELADAVLLSRSGVTRMVDRLERLGLVTRGRVAEDGRGIAATLTDRGQEQLTGASVTHLAAVQRHFVNQLDEADLRDLRRISQRLADGPVTAH
ncbi:MAG TPA: MarR family winged helix-turn-helix transcriptional regulator [Pseudonocardia sp.]|jgi:DNA-binding MarR family transcriptional regulator|nr:MarR family winged helix-turn-helix transcriptional regulator [Pseudonocardia sp.]